MSPRGVSLINPSGRKVDVSIERVEGLLAQGFTRVPEKAEEASKVDQAADQLKEYLSKMTKEALAEFALENCGLEMSTKLTKNLMVELILKAKLEK